MIAGQRAFEGVLVGLAALADSLGELVENGQNGGSKKTRGSQAQREMCAELFKAYEGEIPDELAHAPIATVKGVSAATAGRLASAWWSRSATWPATICCDGRRES